MASGGSTRGNSLFGFNRRVLSRQAPSVRRFCEPAKSRVKDSAHAADEGRRAGKPSTPPLRIRLNASGFNDAAAAG